MALGTRPYSDLENLVMARAGGELTSEAKGRVQALANSAAHIAYMESPYWPRQLVLEPRSVVRGYVDYTEDSYNVYGAGTSAVNGLYKRNGDLNGFPAYTQYASDGTTALYTLWNGVGGWNIGAGLPSDVITSDGYYAVASVASTPPESGWEVVDQGTSPGPIVQALSEIDEVHGYWNGAKWEGASPSSGNFYPDGNGIRLTNATGNVAYVAYKKTLTDTYGDGTGGTTTAVPSEWFEFMAYHAAMSYQVAEQVGVERMTIAFRDVQARLDSELLKISRQGIWRTIAQKMQTYYNFDVSVR